MSPAVIGHCNIQPVFDVHANVEGHDLGSVADAVRKRSRRRCLGAILLVYLLMVVNFQSWLAAFITMALPGAFVATLAGAIITSIFNP